MTEAVASSVSRTPENGKVEAKRAGHAEAGREHVDTRHQQLPLAGLELRATCRACR